ncbi:hypothetical protein P8452_59617 [Trifolium repens]|nr:hypothetical protein P8452_59617 [Trifolium repens]
MQTEKIELYKVKDFESIIIFGDPKLNPNNIKSGLLTKEEEKLWLNSIQIISFWAIWRKKNDGRRRKKKIHRRRTTWINKKEQELKHVDMDFDQERFKQGEIFELLKIDFKQGLYDARDWFY